ncbi:efflux RND transporter permease subunit [Paenibacillus sp. SYP-B4298]|uniref:efflux RND transporter permease subunit n=1 Tax=Paenibacillus sp. SYP-B4298 TaxID=2996034 RepID=UPI0022DD4645|nr:efflux RND transporter permease subunit [Paenibacillus sp. SYP-B4298]
MSWMTKFSLKNGTAVVILCMLVMGYGLFAATQIKQQTFPDLEFPAVFIQVAQPGASTEEIEAAVTGPIEASLQSVKGYESLTSTTSENIASIIIQYPFGSDMDELSAKIESAVNKVDLPDNATVSFLRQSANSQPIYQAAIFSATEDAQALQTRLEEVIAPELEKLDGVYSVRLKGIASEHLDIVVDKEKAAQAGISLSSIKSALQAADYALPLGAVSQDDVTIPIRLTGKLQSLEQVEQLKLGAAASPSASTSGSGQQPPGGSAAGTASGAGAGGASPSSMAQGQLPAGSAASAGAEASAAGSQPLVLSDIAEIRTSTSSDELVRFNGEPSYVVEVVKEQDANTADVADAVKEALAAYEQSGELNVHVITDLGKEINKSVDGLVKEGLYGALFCVLIIFLFLRNVRATLISILSLPISIFATIAVLNQMDYTLNIMTLGGIAVSIGRIVDDSIVVIENIFRWRQEKGDQLKGKALAYQATKEVIGPVASSTIATVVVFAPLAFVGGIIGEFFRPFSIAVVISIVTSLLVAIMLIPVLGSRYFRNVKAHKEPSWLADRFERIIRGALKRKKTVLAAAVALLIGSLSLIPALGVVFFPASATPNATIELVLPAQSSLEQTDNVTAKIEHYVQELTGLESYQASVGSSGASPILSAGGKNKATVNVQFAEGTDMKHVVEQLNAELPDVAAAVVPDTAVQVKEGEQQGPPTGNTIEVNLYSSNVESLAEASKQVEALLKQNGDVKDIANNMNEVTPKWGIELNQEGIDLNVSPYLVMQTVGERLRPVDAGTYTLDNKSRSITVSYKQDIVSREQLESIPIATQGGIRQLKEIADITEEHAWITVNHDDGRMYAKVSATVKNEDEVSAVTKRVEADLNSLVFPEGVEANVGGGLEMISEGFVNIGIAMGAAVGLVFLVMSITFGGLRTPLIIMSSLVFIPVGALGALLIAGQPLSMSGMIGMLMLVGIVVTNAVVLLDRVENNRASGMGLTEAIVEASKTRLRPILMTACATMLALVPLALSGSTTSLISGGLAITVIGGLFSSTMLTLIVVPVIYHLAWSRHDVQEQEQW